MSDINIDKVKDRIAKLLRMAADAGSPHEAAIAAKRARAMMDQHQLDEFDINVEGKKHNFQAKQSGKPYMTMPRWISILAVAVASYNDCHARYEKVFKNGKWANIVTFLGFKDDTEICDEMFQRLMDFANKTAAKYMDDNFGGMTNKRVRDTFRWGCSCELTKRLGEMTRAREMELLGGSTGKALVVVKRDMVAAEFGVTRYTTAKRKVGNDSAAAWAFEQGKREGRKATIVHHLD